jgi:hypothetical protein
MSVGDTSPGDDLAHTLGARSPETLSALSLRLVSLSMTLESLTPAACPNTAPATHPTLAHAACLGTDSDPRAFSTCCDGSDPPSPITTSRDSRNVMWAEGACEGPRFVHKDGSAPPNEHGFSVADMPAMQPDRDDVEDSPLMCSRTSDEGAFRRRYRLSPGPSRSGFTERTGARATLHPNPSRPRTNVRCLCSQT